VSSVGECECARIVDNRTLDSPHKSIKANILDAGHVII
jgi:hypothetical protein